MNENRGTKRITKNFKVRASMNNVQSQYLEVTARLCGCSGDIKQSEHNEVAK